MSLIILQSLHKGVAPQLYPAEKKCKDCGETKPLKKFKKCRTMKDNRENTCYACYKKRGYGTKKPGDQYFNWRQPAF